MTIPRTPQSIEEEFLRKYQGKEITRKYLHRSDRNLYQHLSNHPDLFDQLLPIKDRGYKPRKKVTKEQAEQWYLERYGDQRVKREWLNDNDQGTVERLRNTGLLDKYAPLQNDKEIDAPKVKKQHINKRDPEIIKKEFYSIQNNSSLTRTGLSRSYPGLYSRIIDAGLMDELIPGIVLPKSKYKGMTDQELLEVFEKIPEEYKKSRDILRKNKSRFIAVLKQRGLLDKLLPAQYRTYSTQEEVLEEFHRKFSDEEILLDSIRKKDKSLLHSLKLRGLLKEVKYSTSHRQYNSYDEVLEEFHRKFGYKKIPLVELMEQDLGLAGSLKLRGLLTKVTYQGYRRYKERTNKETIDPTQNHVLWISSLNDEKSTPATSGLNGYHGLFRNVLQECVPIARIFSLKYKMDFDDLIQEASVMLIEHSEEFKSLVEKGSKDEIIKDIKKRFYYLLKEKRSNYSLNRVYDNGESDERNDPIDFREKSPLDNLINLELHDN